MKRKFGRFVPCIAAVGLACVLASVAQAQCGLPNGPIKPSGWQPEMGAPLPQLVTAAFDEENQNEPSIVGMWHVKFTAHTQDGEDIPSPGAVIDNSVVVWHPDGTEIMNSARSAQDGNFCLGVWKRTGTRTYMLNHIPWQGNQFDPKAPPSTIGAPQEGVQILEWITLSPNGNSYAGRFTLKAYDTSGNIYTWFTGTLSAKRITPDTPFTDLF
ncbi:MAG: hypothetical protein ACRD3F_10495 [Acidobacteriaceae bacterium]